MHILVYFVVVGSTLLGLLFCADANLAPRRPLAVMTDFQGLPEPWRGPVFATPAPIPNVNSESVLVAAPLSAGHVALDTASKKKRHAARKHVPYLKPELRYAWQNSNAIPHDRFFGRF
jgi:hypothetical protein